ncbi:hypothetical protein RJ640_026435 [Escallonia rubra]|uniref:Uncharacterized protein n=1 Tax=Escallonia rubra TaxID=112253 RepID=A0AA88UKL5_9ASTE|nr:hypothetical protein RJ640_026435 [Escallonia rubra]
MGTHVSQFITSVAASLANPHLQSPKFPSNSADRCCSAGYGGRCHAGSGRDYNAQKSARTERFKFDLDEDGFFDEKKRIWWSDDDDLDEDDEDEFWGPEASIGIAWLFKVFRAFSWMLPAVAISMLLGTGPNAFFMALALPLAQSALSVVTDRLWGRSTDIPRSKPRTQRRPSARTASNSRMSKGKEQNTPTDKRMKNQQSSAAATEAADNMGERSTRDFGGWDELVKKGMAEKVPRMESEPRQAKKGKLSRRVRSRDKPLLLRLLIAVFPILGSWTKLF